jgi:hypothetical protein
MKGGKAWGRHNKEITGWRLRRKLKE